MIDYYDLGAFQQMWWRNVMKGTPQSWNALDPEKQAEWVGFYDEFYKDDKSWWPGQPPTRPEQTPIRPPDYPGRYSDFGEPSLGHPTGGQWTPGIPEDVRARMMEGVGAAPGSWGGRLQGLVEGFGSPHYIGSGTFRGSTGPATEPRGRRGGLWDRLRGWLGGGERDWPTPVEPFPPTPSPEPTPSASALLPRKKPRNIWQGW